jgi:membrane protein
VRIGDRARPLIRTMGRYREHNLSDWAAALTYYSLLSLFPACIVLVAILGVFGEHPRTTDAVLDIIRDVGPSSAADTLEGTVEQVVRHQGGAGALLGLGLFAAVWASSGYVGAFTRASNVVIGVEERRPFWKRRPLQILVTLAMVMLLAMVTVAIVLTGPVAEAVGRRVGVEGAALTFWEVAKWPILLAMVLVMIAVLYYAGPDTEHRRFRWISAGSIFAIIVWAATSFGFGIYVANFGNYSNSYGALGGVIVFLVWLHLTNSAVLLGLELNAELERERATPPDSSARPAD